MREMARCSGVVYIYNTSLRLEDHEFITSLVFRVRTCLKKQTENLRCYYVSIILVVAHGN